MKQLKIKESITARDSDSISAFLKDINKYHVPTLEEEVALAKRIHEGDQKALNELVTRNLRFVVSVAKQFQGYGLPLGDLIAEGSSGMIRAAELFDETRGLKFCSYAVWWVRQTIMRAISEYSSIMRLPANQRNMINKVNAIKAKFEAEYSREPTQEELADISGVDFEKLSTIDTMGKVVNSLDAPVGDDDSSNLSDLIPDSSFRTDYSVDQDSLRLDLMQAISVLPEKEQKVLTMAFGLDGKDWCTLEEIADAMCLTKERVRQIRETALRHIRNNAASVALLQKYCAA